MAGARTAAVGAALAASVVSATVGLATGRGVRSEDCTPRLSSPWVEKDAINGASRPAYVPLCIPDIGSVALLVMSPRHGHDGPRRRPFPAPYMR